MSSADWAVLANSVGTGTVDRGVSAGFTPPNGGGSFVYGYNSLTPTPGAVGLYTSQASYAPMAKGGSIRAAMKRATSGGITNFSPLIFIGLQSNEVTGAGYLLGLSDEDPSHILLRKGSLNGGLPFTTIGTLGALRRSAASFAPNTWVHLRLDMVVNTNGDVVLKCFQNADLTTHDVTAPDWQPISGMADFIDDSLGVNSASQPYTSGYVGFGFVSKDVSRRAFFDNIEVLRQL